MGYFGLILAGGEGRRLGGVDKALVPLGGQPLLAHVMARFAPQVERVAISANGDGARFAPWAQGCPVLPDPPAHLHEGPLAGILAGLDWAQAQGAQGVVTVAVDTPFLPHDLVARLAGEGPALAMSSERRHPTFAAWPVGLRDEVAQALRAGERRLGRPLQGARAVVFEAQPDPFFNINTPEDLALAAGRAVR
ncbi:molybdenum cofactor guanylyltransferase MobA [Thioclava sp. 'Guangxiensis']|uniref:molybdenum cofactor guanylyltransferase MobA n=1 Tax=Thioclava sp. 'Guangxiensis' TaxID=3149044 RepID=UPI0038780BBE